MFQIPFTDIQGLLERGQVADITAEVEALPYAADFNPNVLAVAQDADGAIFGVPIAAYGIGLHYNRAMFEEAGLDPDAPPTTWDEVREAAAAISEATGQAGFAQMSQNNTGGWMLTTLSYAFGGRLQERDRRRRRRDDRQPRHDGRPRVPQGAALGGQLDGFELPARTGARSTRRSPPGRSACT